MPRTKTGVVRRRKHNKILKATKGFFGARGRLYKRAKEAYLKAGENAFAGRKLKKRTMRSMWIVRINAGLAEHDIKYSAFINLLTNSKIELDRKMLAKLALEDKNTFSEIVNSLKAK